MFDTYVNIMNKFGDAVRSSTNDGLLGIYVITYNRANKLRETLGYLFDSALRNFPITVLDNCSNDKTVEVATSFIGKIPGLSIVSNRFNIGLGANFLKAFEIGNYKYTWVLCDDDFVSATEVEDVLQVINEGKVDLIHVGAHAQKQWPQGGQTLTPRQLLSKAYPYFKFSSFIPCNIFKTKPFVEKFMVKAYENIVYAYPHMPFLFSLYENDTAVYIAKNPWVVAKPSDSGYSQKVWYYWWMHTCELLKNKEDVRLAYLDQWKDIGDTNDTEGVKSLWYITQITDDVDYVKRFIKQYFTISDRISVFMRSVGAYYFIDKLYWFKIRMLN
jgi:glycosyltransferase involved in cell wall biosynthesis